VRAGDSVAGAGRTLDDAHGTIVAGLAVGDDEDRGVTGVAPDAHVVPIRVTAARDDSIGTTDPGPELSGDRLAAGIRRAVERRKADNIRVINLSLVLDDVSKPVAAAIDDATEAGILVVAAVGNRTADPADEDDPDRYRVGERKVRFPATHDGVLAVTALDQNGDFDPTFVWTGPDTDVAAPAVGAITVTAGGGTCAVADIASSWATAQVSGLAALLFAENGKWTPAQVATRIEATARGAYTDNALDGHGMVQPLEALTARLDISRNGELRRTPAYVEERPKLPPPERPADVAAESRRTMLWWGIGAGGAVLLGLLLRPLTARRRG
jgi:membrane-anchored mycosin MYCP